MPIIKQQSSILSEQELQLLASHSTEAQNSNFKIYSYQCKIQLPHYPLHLSDSIEQLILMLSASPRGNAVILPDSIELEPAFNKLLAVLARRADISVFWLGKLPSMETNLSVFVHCIDEQRLQHNVMAWKNYLTHTFSEWLAQYPVAFITEHESKKQRHKKDLSAMGLTHTEFLNAQSALTKLADHKLLIIDLDTPQLRLIDLLNNLANNDKFPIVIIYSELPNNVCRATHTIIENHGFPILASLSVIPDKVKWGKLFSSLFAKVYLKHWVNEEAAKTGAYKVFHLETQSVSSYFCLYGMTKQQIATLPKHNIRHIINAQSIQDWFPDGVKRDIRTQLAEDLNCGLYEIDICIESPERIQRTSVFFSALVMARLSTTKIYWSVEEENNLLTDNLKNFPISDVILSEALSHQLLTEPSEVLLEFIEQARIQQVNVIANLQQNRSTNEALSLYGIESVLDKQSYIE